MIRCNPIGICSWNFRLDGEGRSATLEFNWIGEEGIIVADGEWLSVTKHGWLSGHWTLNRDQRSIASGQKNNAFTRSFEIQEPSCSLSLHAESALGRSFLLERSSSVIAAFRPVHAFTRRATIEATSGGCEFTTLCFSFWLVVLMWRRAHNNAAASSS